MLALAGAPPRNDEGHTITDEFADVGLSVEETPPGAIPPLEGEEFPRPNGVMYTPRQIGGIQDIAYMRRNRDHQEHVLLYGPPGTGKSALPEAAFFPDALENTDGPGYLHTGMETLICSIDTSEADFFGTYVQDPATGNFIWVPGPLQRAVEADIPLYVDEILLAESRVLSSTLYPVMDGRGVLRIPMNPTLPPIPVGPGFFVIGAGNPNVPGANFSEALRDRFPHQVEVGTDWALARRLKVPNDIITVARALDQRRIEGDIDWSPQLRALLAYRANRAAFGQEYALNAMLGKAPVDDREIVEEELTRAFRGTEIVALRMGGRYGQPVS